jgi:hypothetical protein
MPRKNIGVLFSKNKYLNRFAGTPLEHFQTEKRYHSNEKELLALKKGIEKFSYFLLPKKFIA